jgi:Phospholipase_D-nuclease N-terminal
MKIRQFLDVVPKPARVWAVVIVCCAVVGGLAAGYYGATTGKNMAANGGFAILVGILAAIWILCLGFVFADARRRDMPAVAWMLMAMMVPNLLGFLLYFVLRKPLMRPCATCGRAVLPEQPFCSWCGSERSSASVTSQEGLAAQ